MEYHKTAMHPGIGTAFLPEKKTINAVFIEEEEKKN